MVRESTALTRTGRHLLLVAATLAVAGCTGGEEEEAAQPKQDHVFKEQTKALDKARDVGRQLEEAAKRKSDGTQ